MKKTTKDFLVLCHVENAKGSTASIAKKWKHARVVGKITVLTVVIVSNAVTAKRTFATTVSQKRTVTIALPIASHVLRVLDAGEEPFKISKRSWVTIVFPVENRMRFIDWSV